jgi:hypothetical protein
MGALIYLVSTSINFPTKFADILGSSHVLAVSAIIFEGESMNDAKI